MINTKSHAIRAIAYEITNTPFKLFKWVGMGFTLRDNEANYTNTGERVLFRDMCKYKTYESFVFESPEEAYSMYCKLYSDGDITE